MSSKKGFRLGKSINDLGYSQFVTRLKTKALENDKTVLVVDKYFPSSQLCSVCDFQNKEIKNLSVREWKCPRCLTEHDRDINAAINLKKQGLNCVLSDREEFKSVETNTSIQSLVEQVLSVKQESDIKNCTNY